MQEPSILAITVNYGTPELALRALASLEPARAAFPSLRAVCVDNASPDDSRERIAGGLAAAGRSSWARLLSSPVNGGFAAGNNLALRGALAGPEPVDYVLLLNPDAALDPGALEALVAHLEQNPRAGIVGPRTEVGRGRHLGSAFRFPGLWNSLDEGLHFGPLTRLLARFQLAPPPRPEAHASDWLSGGCLLLRSEVFEAVGLFDEGFFLYFEEVELCHRAARAGFESWYVPEASVLHEAGAATGVTGAEALSRRMPRYWFDSRRRYLARTRGRTVAWLADLLLALGASLYGLRRLVGAPRKDPPYFLGDLLRFNLLSLRGR